MRATKRIMLVWMAACLALLTACTVTVPLGGGGAAQDGTAASDATDPEVAANVLEGIDANSCVVALSRSIGEMWLLAGGELAGATDDTLTLNGVSEDTVSICTVTKPDADDILELEPDLVLLNDELPAHQEVHAQLAEAGIPVLVVDVNSFDDYAAVMSSLTTATGRDDLFEQNVTQVQARIDQAIERSAQENRGSYLALRISPDASEVLGSDYFAGEMLEDLGLTNAATDALAGVDASAADIAKVNPDWVFVIYHGDATKAQKAYEQTFVADASWAELNATKAGHVVVLPKDLFQYKPNARWAEAYAYLSQVLHGAWA